MGSLLGRLEAREAAARERAGLLRAEMAVLAEKLAAEEAAVSRLSSARETVLDVMAGPDLPEDIAFAARQSEREGEEVGPGAELGGDGAATAALTGVVKARIRPGGVLVPEFSAGTSVSVLPQVYRDVLGVVERSGQGVRAKEVCEELALGGEPKHIEALRGKLKRLARRGWLVETRPGVFELAEGVRSSVQVQDSSELAL